MDGNKIALAGHPRPCGTRLLCVFVLPKHEYFGKFSSLSAPTKIFFSSDPDVSSSIFASKDELRPTCSIQYRSKGLVWLGFGITLCTVGQRGMAPSHFVFCRLDLACTSTGSGWFDGDSPIPGFPLFFTAYKMFHFGIYRHEKRVSCASCQWFALARGERSVDISSKGHVLAFGLVVVSFYTQLVEIPRSSKALFSASYSPCPNPYLSTYRNPNSNTKTKAALIMLETCSNFRGPFCIAVVNSVFSIVCESLSNLLC